MNRLNYFEASPDLAKKLVELGQAAAKGANDAKTLALVNIRVAQLNGCTFCLDMHVKEAKIHGERELRVYHIAAWRESPLFTAKERAILEWTEALTVLPREGISPEIYQRVKSELSDKELSDLTFSITVINSFTRLNAAFLPVPGSFDKMLGTDRAGLK